MEQHLKDLHEWCAQHDPKGILVVKKFPNHAKVLIRDEAYAVMGSLIGCQRRALKNAERSWVVKTKICKASRGHHKSIYLHEMRDFEDVLLGQDIDT